MPHGSNLPYWLLQFFDCQLRVVDGQRCEEQVRNGEGFRVGKGAVNIA